jgi:uncharacterized membrane protein
MERFGSIMIWTSALGALLIAGVFFAFSSFVMSGLGRLPEGRGAAAMNSINVTVINPLFMSVFLGTGIAAAALAVMSFSSLPDPYAIKIVTGAAFYVLGSVGVTMLFNVPLNDALAAADGPEGATLWAVYLKKWIMWNHVRGFASFASGILLISALTA